MLLEMKAFQFGMLQPISSEQRGSLQHFPGKIGNNAAILEDERPISWSGSRTGYTWSTLTAKATMEAVRVEISVLPIAR